MQTIRISGGSTPPNLQNPSNHRQGNDCDKSGKEDQTDVEENVRLLDSDMRIFQSSVNVCRNYSANQGGNQYRHCQEQSFDKLHARRVVFSPQSCWAKSDKQKPKSGCPLHAVRNKNSKSQLPASMR
jgi:hypothetical protein